MTTIPCFRCEKPVPKNGGHDLMVLAMYAYREIDYVSPPRPVEHAKACHACFIADKEKHERIVKARAAQEDQKNDEPIPLEVPHVHGPGCNHGPMMDTGWQDMEKLGGD